ncbi:RNA chaperone Hfq [Halanaerobiaceae bacterium Z-7014]|uniref:RNA chaperone Hfq n=1 Tax=Halonatronomonas betaini TaxID=2778430 RepID=A0A931ATN8_9FIRM|nr:RNA chaperone Hfq [Halonatronomonas betaini]MBF8436250.1 RNA chaperone Hfq [Halonatronomonas betaini]
MSNNLDYQSKMLEAIKKKNIWTKFYLTDGRLLEGEIVNFDNFVIVIRHGEKNKMIYKHAIATVAPDEDVKAGVGIVDDE